ncbi:MmcQ/YjbR family DNA-binding protein [Vibrio stylophorae]|nr:MmcQ/YjbR family DNA-binding protein [Vibrio stylophorae]
MNQQAIELFLSTLAGAQAEFPFGPEAKVYKVMGKMFALVTQDETPTRITLKATPVDVDILVDEYEAISRGYHMNKRHWITVTLSDELSGAMLNDLMVRSYDLVVSGLTKAQQAALKV